MRPRAFNTYIAPAQPYAQIWRLLVGLLLILFVYAAATAVIFVALYPIKGPLEYFGFIMGLVKPSTPAAMTVVLLTFVGMFLGPFIAAPACHYRSPFTLFGPRAPFLRSFGRALAVLLPVYVISGAIYYTSEQPIQNMDAADWMWILPMALFLILIQITAEELLFRAYLPQQLAARFRSGWIWAVIPSVIFGLLHYNPELGAQGWLVVLWATLFGLMAVDLTRRTGNIGAAMAFHFVNNCFAMLFIAQSGTLTGYALFRTQADITEMDATGGLLIEFVLMFVLWRVLIRVLSR